MFLFIVALKKGKKSTNNGILIFIVLMNYVKIYAFFPPDPSQASNWPCAMQILGSKRNWLSVN